MFSFSKPSQLDSTLILSSFGSEELAHTIQKNINVPFCNLILDYFACGETRVEIENNVRNRHVIIVSQMRCGSVNDDFMSLNMILDSVRRSDVSKITLVLPYYPYSRSDKKDRPRVPIGAAVVANMLKMYEVDNVLSLDLHAGQLQGLFDKGFHNLYMLSTYVEEIKKRYRKDEYVLISPDAGSIKRTEAYAEKLSSDYIVLHKQRDYTKPGTVLRSMIIGDPQLFVGKTGILIDDILDSGNTIVKAVRTLTDCGLRDAVIIITHGFFTGGAVENIQNCDEIKEVICSNSIPISAEAENCPKIHVVDCGQLISQALGAIVSGGSVSQIFFVIFSTNFTRGERVKFSSGETGCGRSSGREESLCSERREALVSHPPRRRVFPEEPRVHEGHQKSHRNSRR